MVWFLAYILLGVVALLVSAWVAKVRGWNSDPFLLMLLPLDGFWVVTFLLWPAFLWIAWQEGKLEKSEANVHANPNPKLPDLIGKTGTVVAALKPGGMVRIGDLKFDALAAGELIEAGQKIRVVSQDSLCLKVERAV